MFAREARRREVPVHSRATVRKRGVERVHARYGCRPDPGRKGCRGGTRWLRAFAVLPLLASVLAACGGDEDSGRPTLDWYNFPDDSGALQKAADRCSQASGGRYRISYHKLPRAADGQRQQLVRRLAAEDDSKWVFYEGNFHEYEDDKKRRLGEEGARPHRPRYKALM